MEDGRRTVRKKEFFCMDKRDRKKNIECTIAEVTDSNVYGVDRFVENALVID